jgi:hypothetical protein
MKFGILAFVVAILVAALVYFGLFGASGTESGERLYIASVVTTFRSSQSEITRDLGLPTDSPTRATSGAQWMKALTTIHGVSNVLVSKNEIAVLNDSLGLALLFKSTGTSDGRWSCMSYPRLSFENLCEKMASGQGPGSN